MQHRGEVEGQPGETERRAGQFAGGARRKIPAMAAFLLAGTIMLGVAGGWYLAHPAPAGPPVIEMLSPADVAEGMKTLSAQAIQQASSASRQCRIQFGHITVSTPGNPAGGTVRFRIGAYESPPFVVTDQPQRIAIPNPFPETGGTGMLSVDGEAKGLIVALYPPTSMEPVNGSATTPVIFRPTPKCKP
jgi:hypothetical protein